MCVFFIWKTNRGHTQLKKIGKLIIMGCGSSSSADTNENRTRSEPTPAPKPEPEAKSSTNVNTFVQDAVNCHNKLR